jgi:acetylornithine deacetylase/succinyl-diaminopimelate desuccinylase-like protein
MNLASVRGSAPTLAGTLALTRALIERRSLTPNDAGCQELIASRLVPLGFRAERAEDRPEIGVELHAVEHERIAQEEVEMAEHPVAVFLAGDDLVVAPLAN